MPTSATTSDDKNLPSNTSNKSNNAPGGLLGYFINRKIKIIGSELQNNNMHPANYSDHGAPTTTTTTNDIIKRDKSKRSTIRKYHEMVNAGGSAYFGSMVLDDSDSDDDNIVGRKNIYSEQQQPSAAAKSWLASYQTKPTLPLPSKENDAADTTSSSSLSLSWISSAWQSVSVVDFASAALALL